MAEAGLLVVEDESLIALAIEQDLKAFGYQVRVANSGEEAIQKAGEKVPNLALMDIMLNGPIDGIQTAEKLLEISGIPSVYLTAYADEEILSRAKLTAPFGYLVKPYQKSALHTTIEVALLRLQIEREMKTSGALIAESLSGLKEPLAIVDTNLRLKFVNRAFGELTEFGDEIVIGKELSKVLQSETIDGAATLEQQMTGAFETIGNIGNISGKLVLAGKNNKKIPVDYGLVALNSGGGSDAGLLVRLHSGLTSVPPRQESPPDVKKKSRATKQDPSDESFTGLPSRKDAECALGAVIEQRQAAFIACFVLERFSFYTSRFGLPTAREIAMLYSMNLAQGLAESDQLFHWMGPSFIALLEQPDPFSEAKRRVASLANTKLERILRLDERTVLLQISGTATVFDLLQETSLNTLVQKIDSYTANQLNR